MLKLRKIEIEDLLKRYASLARVLGKDVMARIFLQVVCFIGMGRLNSMNIVNFNLTGFLYGISIDPQRVTKDSQGQIIWIREHDVRCKKFKTNVAAEQLHGRMVIDPIIAAVESLEADEGIAKCDFGVIGCNTVAGRWAAAEKFIRAGKPYISVALGSDEHALAGSVGIWSPKMREQGKACMVCGMVNARHNFKDRGGLFSPSIGIVSAVATYVAVLCVASDWKVDFNSISIDLRKWAIRPSTVMANSECQVCGSN